MRPLVVLLLLTAGCADFSGAGDPAFGLPDVVVELPTYAQDVGPLLDRRCAIGGCHTPASMQAGLSLAFPSGYDAIVGRPSRFRPAQSLVAPGDAAASWIVTMIGDAPAERGGFSRMPLAATPLTPNQIATIVRWIDRGAPRN